jgi:oxygen-independent coproporphyrinogen-3 oxidase
MPPARKPDDLGVYIHVPFCERICPYCDFAVVAARPLTPASEDDYVETLLRELESRRRDFEGRELATVYLGGGTPSLLRPESVARLIDAVRATFPGEPEEVTLEVNPSTLERERLPGFHAAGVDRVSLGAQSFDDLTLRRLGRAHRADEIDRTLDAVHAAGIANLSLDLILAAPGQTREASQRDVEAAIARQPDHLSIYELTLEPGTPFAKAAAEGKLATALEEDALAMLENLETWLEPAGYRRYEISSHARPGREAVHNRRYWERRPVLGLGMGAVSSEPVSEAHPYGARRANPRSLAAYGAVARGEAPPELDVLGEAEASGEAVFLALRTTAGLDVVAFEAEFGPLARRFGGELERLCGAGLLEIQAGRLRLTPRGRMLSDSVFEHFVA